MLRTHICSFALVAFMPRVASATPAIFDLNEIRVEGSTVLPQETVEETVYPFLGPGRTAQDVDKARAALQDAYQKAGFATVSVVVPQQNLQAIKAGGGVVVVQVIERRVERLRVVGAKYFVPDAVRAGAPSLAPGTVPNMHKVAADLLTLNRFPDRTVQPSLRPGRKPDTVDVDLNVADSNPLHGSIEFNNRYNADTKPLRLDASLSYNNLFQRGDSVTLAYQVAPQDVADAEVTSASYLFRIPNSTLSLLMSYLHSNSNVTALGVTDVAGRGTSAGFRLLVPLGSTSDFSHSFSVGWDYKRYYELDTFLSTHQLASAPITYYPVTANYAANWATKNSSTDFTLAAEFGLSGLGSDRDAFYNKASNAPPGFAVLRSSVSRQQNLPYDVQLWGQVSGQITNEPLVSSEQISAGGADSVRGYLEAEDLGDYGATLQTELRSPSLGKYIGKPLKNLRLHLFYDAGEVTLVRPLTGYPSAFGLSSVGVGMRVNLWGNLDASLQDAQTLNTGTTTHAGTNRVLFRVSGEF
jgi:hemolysin activation/secretion protein